MATVSVALVGIVVIIPAGVVDYEIATGTAAGR